MADDPTADDPAPAIVRLDSRIVYANRWTTVREDRIRRADGAEGIYGYIDRPDFVVVLPLDADGSVHLVEQYRYPVGGRYWELPQGVWREGVQSDPLEAAHGELREETGLIAGRMTHAGRLFEAYGIATQAYDVFIAQDLTPGPQQLEPEEQDLVCRAFAMPVFLDMLRTGEIMDATTLAAMGLLFAKGLIPRP